MDEDHVDPAVLKSRAATKGHRAADVVVGPRPRLRRFSSAAPDGSGHQGIAVSAPRRVSIQDVAVTKAGLAPSSDKVVVTN